MIRGIGVDLVHVSDIQNWLEIKETHFLRNIFSKSELAEALQNDCAEYLAGRFAVKEAVFKAIIPLIPKSGLDFRKIESSHDVYGAPYVIITEELKHFLFLADVDRIHISLSGDDGLVIAYAIAEKTE